jgi:hypothetical protein
MDYTDIDPPYGLSRGKLGYLNMKGEKMEREFMIQTKISLVDLANFTSALWALGEAALLRTLNSIGQTAFKLALEHLEEFASWDKIESIEDALEELERIGLIDRESSSIKQRALFRNRRRNSLREFQGEVASQPQLDAKKEEEILQAALKFVAKQQPVAPVAPQQEEVTKQPNNEVASQLVDMDTRLTKEELLKRFIEADSQKLDNKEPLF